MIDEQNYYQVNNRGLSQSKIKDYKLCPNYFYRKNISGELVKEHKKTFDIGSAVDDILTQRTKLNNFAICENKLTTKAGKAEKLDLEMKGKTVLTRTDYNKIIEIADATMNTSAYKDIAKSFTFQKILVVDPKDFDPRLKELGDFFTWLYGMLDAYKIDEKWICDLLDIKTANEIEPNRYIHKFIAFGYDKQLWFYSKLLKAAIPQIKGFRFWHLSAEKSEPYRVKLFPIPNRVINNCDSEMISLIQTIAKDKEFKREDASFSNPTPLFPIWDEA